MCKAVSVIIFLNTGYSTGRKERSWASSSRGLGQIVSGVAANMVIQTAVEADSLPAPVSQEN